MYMNEHNFQSKSISYLFFSFLTPIEFHLIWTRLLIELNILWFFDCSEGLDDFVFEAGKLNLHKIDYWIALHALMKQEKAIKN